MDLQLTTEEIRALRQALTSYMSDLRTEISDTDNAEFRRGLREERAHLENVARKLDELSSSALQPEN